MTKFAEFTFYDVREWGQKGSSVSSSSKICRWQVRP
jgi:hypothetical protein